MTRYLEVLATGPLTTVQDLGRPGFSAWGVTTSGAVDRGALRLGNRLLGNPKGAAGLEVTLGGLHVRAGADLEFTLTGARCPATVDGGPVAHNAPVRVAAGATLELAPPAAGLRTYLAVRGGIEVPAMLGSRATDVLAGLGPVVPAPGDRLPIGPGRGDRPEVDLAPHHDPAGGEVTLGIRLGPRHDWFTPAALATLTSTTWSVTPASNRVGLRLDGPELARARTGELPTEGMAAGALQVPPSGLPTLLLADHPITGGYPVVAVVLDADFDLAAQVRPGQVVRFRDAGGRA